MAHSEDTCRLWTHLGGEPALLDALTISGPAEVFPSPFAVTTFAASAIGVATLAAAELLSARTASAQHSARIDTVEAAAAFRSEALFEPIGWERPPIWDPIAGDYRAADRWIKLHTNYASHRTAVRSVLGDVADRAATAAAVARWDAAKLEQAIVGAGGCAATMYTRDEWRAHPHGIAVMDEPPIVVEDDGAVTSSPLASTSALRSRACASSISPV
ncbi:MAG: CoA transferase, family protein [Labilithrix sp.]|nr:CoA transferase, family protein [Labilithrix sp.]